MRCTFHQDTPASSLCARCYRALCPRCAHVEAAGSVCAAGCGSHATVLPPMAAVGATRVRVAQWTRLGATSFLVAIGAAMLQLAILALPGYAASMLCLSVAWHRHRQDRMGR